MTLFMISILDLEPELSPSVLYTLGHLKITTTTGTILTVAQDKVVVQTS